MALKMMEDLPTLPQDRVRICVNIDPGSASSLNLKPQLEPGQLRYVPPPPPPEPATSITPEQAQVEPQPQVHSVVQPAGPTNTEPWDQVAQQDNDDATSTTSHSDTGTETTISDTNPMPEDEPAPMPKPIFDAPFRLRQEILHPIPNHVGYFYGPGGADMYAGGQTRFYGVSGQELRPGQAQANAQLMMQGMGTLGRNVGLGGMHLQIWQQPYWGWM